MILSWKNWVFQVQNKVSENQKFTVIIVDLEGVSTKHPPYHGSRCIWDGTAGRVKLIFWWTLILLDICVISTPLIGYFVFYTYFLSLIPCLSTILDLIKLLESHFTDNLPRAQMSSGRILYILLILLFIIQSLLSFPDRSFEFKFKNLERKSKRSFASFKFRPVGMFICICISIPSILIV